MKKEEISFEYQVFDDASSLMEADRSLLQKAKLATQTAYAPYSQFCVGATALLANGATVSGSNQENASSPAGLCAERVVLAAAAASYPGIVINTIAISYDNKRTSISDHPVAPCGICRQSLLETQLQQQTPIRLVLSGWEGNIFIINDVRHLLPLSFTAADME
ncbi:MAG: cytidine deaminase [Sphingobacteriales bacterium]|nr:cytidine deaminase [Sphingobacteriales bacterium]OJY88777.1 MAG: cytidine deaminase [Sphingobacteriales bacterium 44-15]